jgi:hypothetical protein
MGDGEAMIEFERIYEGSDEPGDGPLYRLLISPADFGTTIQVTDRGVEFGLSLERVLELYRCLSLEALTFLGISQ